jgi:capsular polysaccharide biosynthesis protein
VSRTRVLLAVLFVAAVAGASVAYSFLAPKRYEATARVVVHPVPSDDDTLTGIDVLRDSGDDSRAVGTAASYFRTPEVLRTVATRLRLSEATLEDDLDVHPLSGANVLLIVGSSSDRNVAAEIANGVMQEGISERTAHFQAQVRAQLDKVSQESTAAAQRRALDLQALQGRPDPTVEALSNATAPSSASWPKPAKVIPLATAGAIVLAVLALLLPEPARRRRREFTATADALAEHERVLGNREAGLAQRQSELEGLIEEARAATAAAAEAEDRAGLAAAHEQALDVREHSLEARERALEEREQAQEEREQALEEREQALEERERELEERAAAPVGPAAEPEPEQVAAAPGPRGVWTIQELERLVSERGNEHPDRVDEWRYYVHYLREHAGPEGQLPRSFDPLIDETFAELLAEPT